MSKIVVISGATKGIGLAIAEVFARNGFDVLANARTKKDLDAMQKRWKKDFPQSRLYTKTTDMRKKASIAAFAEFVQSHTEHVDVLINNAGVFKPGFVTSEEEGLLELQMETNVYSAYYLTRAVLPLMIATSAKPTHIFNMCSIASQIAYPNGGSYSISKFALLGFSKVLREELKPKHIKVTSILPGATWSASWAGVELPRERLMEAQDVADTIWAAYLLSKKCCRGRNSPPPATRRFVRAAAQ